jgi:Ca-activated chloride channel family protein
MRALALVLALAFPTAAPACEAALVLAMDVSGSVDRGEWRLQADGLAAALRDREVAEVLVQGQIALSVVHWSAVGQQAVVLPWQRMLSHRAVQDFAARVETMPRAFPGSDTAVGEALDVSIDQFAAVPDCRRRIVDMSGDGDENVGYTTPRARARAIAEGVEVNALAIEAMGLSITNFYRRWVITPGGFVETAQGHLDYARAIRVKLLRELTKPGS